MEKYPIGSLVWAKMGKYPPWPGRVSVPPPDSKKPIGKKNQNSHWIYFFKSNNYAWIEESSVKSYEENKELLGKNAKGKLKTAIDTIEYHIANNGEEEFKKSEEEMLNPPILLPPPPPPLASSPPLVVSETPDGSIDEKPTSTRKSGKKHRHSHSRSHGHGHSHSSDSSSPKKKKKKDRSERFADSPTTSTSTISFYKRKEESILLQRQAAAVSSSSIDYDLSTISETLKNKNIEPSPLKFGFLGLGTMGSGIVMNLLQSRHSVIIWNRHSEKCDKFMQFGAEVGNTPQDVVAEADITFCCVSDPEAAKQLVFGNNGVLQVNLENKGYVEMSGIDSETSLELADAIESKGGTYLEAQIQGTKEQADEGTFVILAAGDRKLFDSCQKPFEAMGKSSFFLGTVGSASKMNIILQMVNGISLTGVAEGLALADRAGVSQKDVLEILGLTKLSCPTVMEKGEYIIQGSFNPKLALMHMQKDMRLALDMGDKLEQPLPVSAASNEVFKHARRLGYASHDVSAVYIKLRF